MKERTCVIIKPDGVDIILLKAMRKIAENNLVITNIKEIKLTKELIREQYEYLVDDPCYQILEEFMLSKPIIAMIVEGENAITKTQSLIGPIEEGYIPINTIRGDHIDYHNSKDLRIYDLMQSSDSIENAEIEIKRYFNSDRSNECQKKFIK